MNALLTAFFAFLFSFGHALSLRQVEAIAPPDASITSNLPAPTRQQVALTGCTNGYAGSACPSQPMTMSAWLQATQLRATQLHATQLYPTQSAAQQTDTIQTEPQWNAPSIWRDQPSDTPRPTPPLAAF